MPVCQWTGLLVHGIPILGESFREMRCCRPCDGGQMAAPAMTGPHTAAAEITKITAMRVHDHQSLSADCAGAAVEFLRVSALWSFATAFLLGRDDVREELGLC